jgi:hypothetical protein
MSDDNKNLAKSFIKIQRCINILFDSKDYQLFKHIINEDEQAILNFINNRCDAPASNNVNSDGKRGRGRPRKSGAIDSNPVEGSDTPEADGNDGVIENVVTEL